MADFHPPQLRPRVVAACVLATVVGTLGIAVVDPWSRAHGARLAGAAAALPVAAQALLDVGLWLFYAGFVVALVLGLWRRRRAWIETVAVYVAAELTFAAGLVRLLKIACGRPRPYVGAVDWSCWTLVSDFHSLPSGHAADVMVGFAVVEIVARARWIKWLVGLIAVASMTARVLQGQHYLSDVALGGLVGYLGGLAGIALLRRWRTSRMGPITYN